MIGRDEKMLIVFEWIRTAAKSDISVLILGPTGSGKEVVARMIHELSRRGTENFQAVNCAALPDTLFESEIFGYEKGAFTGAHDRKPGRVELADRGTLFLDEIGDLSLVAQAKLLRVLEDRRFERLGGQTLGAGRLPTDLGDEPAARSVRSRQPLSRGPLLSRERVLDPAAVASRAANRHRRCSPTGSLHGTAQPTVFHSTPRCSRPKRCRACNSYPWPGNIRELESTVSRAALSAPGRVIRDTRHRVPASSGRASRRSAATSADAGARPSARTSSACSTPRLEQEGSRAAARDQPRHAVPQDRRVRPRAEHAAVAKQSSSVGASSPKHSRTSTGSANPSSGSRFGTRAIEPLSPMGQQFTQI